MSEIEPPNQPRPTITKAAKLCKRFALGALAVLDLHLGHNRPVLRELIVTRTLKPLLNLKAWAYFIVAIVAIGGMGLWIAQAMHLEGAVSTRDLLLNYVTFVFALAIVGLIDVSFESQTTSDMRAMFLLVALFALYPVAYWGYMYFRGALPARIETEQLVLHCLPSALAWWIANASDPRFTMQAKPDVAAGGNPLKDIK